MFLNQNFVALISLLVAIVAIIIAISARRAAARANARARRAHSLFLMRQIYQMLQESRETHHLTKQKISNEIKRLATVEEGSFNRSVRVMDEKIAQRKVGLSQCLVLSNEGLEWEVFSAQVNRLRLRLLEIPLVPLKDFVDSPEYEHGETLLKELMQTMSAEIAALRKLPA